MISRKAKYAITAALHLAGLPPGETRLISQIAERERIPKKFLEAILLELKNAGILGSKKGKGGGYHLARRPGEVTVGGIMRIIDGPLAPVRCVSRTAPEMCEDCKEPEICAIRQVMGEVRDATAAILDNVTLAQMLVRLEEARTDSRQTVMYYI